MALSKEGKIIASKDLNLIGKDSSEVSWVGEVNTLESEINTNIHIDGEPYIAYKVVDDASGIASAVFVPNSQLKIRY